MEDAVRSEDAEPLPAASQNNDLAHLTERPEPTQAEHWRPSSTSPEPGSSSPPSSPPTQQTQSSAVSALQSKVKSPTERKVIWKEPASATQDKRMVSGTFMLGYALTDAWGSSSSDEEMEPHKSKPQLGRSEYDHVTPMLAIPRGLGEGASVENQVSDACGTQGDHVSLSDKPWMPPNCFWSSGRPKTVLPNMDVPAGTDKGSLCSVASKMSHRFPRELQRSDSLESHLRRYNHVEVGSTIQSALWRSDSLESVCSSGSSLSLAERVEMNRGLLKQMLHKAQTKYDEGGQVTNPEQRLEDSTHSGGRGICGQNDSDLDSGISLQGSEISQRAFVLADDLPLSPRHEQAKRLLERARMKARSNPLKADHTILPVQRDNLELLSWVGIHQAPLAGKEGVAVPSGNLSDSSSGDSAGGTRRRHGQSPTRVRFEDESEKEAEVRYLERLRQRRRAGERAQGLLVSKPSLSSYICGQTEADSGSIFWKAKAKKSLANGNGHYRSPAVNRQCNSCGTFLHDVPGSSLNPPVSNGEVGGKKIPCWVAPTLPNRLVRIEQIKETYIGTTSPAIVQSDGTHCSPPNAVDYSSAKGTLQKLKKKVRKLETKNEPLYVNGLRDGDKLAVKGSQMCFSNGVMTLPHNPYTTEQPGQMKIAFPVAPPLPPKGEPPNLPQPTPPPLQPKKSALKSSSKGRSSGQRVVTLMSSPEYCVVQMDSVKVGGAVESFSQEQPSAGLGYWEDRSLVLSPSLPRARNIPLQGEEWSRTTDVEQAVGPLGSDATSDSAESTQTRLNDGHVRGPIKSVLHRANSPNLSQADAEHREGRSKLSLRRFFSAMGLNSVGLLGKGRSSSMDHLSLHPKPNSNTTLNPRQTSPSTSPSPTHRHYNQLKKAPSLQTIRLGSPFLQMRRSSSAQNLQITMKKTDRSSAYSPGEQPCSPVLTRDLQRALSVEDVGRPSAVRSVGRVAQAFPDGTILLELSRPPNGPFGFLISRGKGRPDSGVYVEEMGDSNTEKLYAGLLGVGDEVLEVNGEKVAGLSLDLVTRLMTQNSTASIRVLRHRRLQR
ncbi:hypothetical protein E1301_Tti015213 [Triplophysa tibetana]|uniref:PDZ domain-containing protein n=1 Tax=Triplophysa tibetana TaxID=1572043 RepID=A0A5A9NT22_9TELE|nr:hypothetical protein E1301_Tti015213 [Triplophysa tibetana]